MARERNSPPNRNVATTLEHVADEINVAPFSAERYLADIHSNQLIRHNGKVNQVIGVVIESHGPAMSVGETCETATNG